MIPYKTLVERLRAEAKRKREYIKARDGQWINLGMGDVSLSPDEAEAIADEIERLTAELAYEEQRTADVMAQMGEADKEIERLKAERDGAGKIAADLTLITGEQFANLQSLTAELAEARRANQGLTAQLIEAHGKMDRLLAHCPDAECHVCGEVICPRGEPLHFHHDGCPACCTPSEGPDFELDEGSGEGSDERFAIASTGEAG